eukprot:CAMPEP_0177424886 /NCGR_PEP_ID=MMETSP0368-20130122/72702_1 /TAXON_ID=447022 ORGANISM="Scrippsiella hangoei-like, Strain SHHI-4" /NCGR_SAMPLE_ID=MMETSP0368 /ASSEMBLY_ACC=CAM_ASM_000363 /LENGTH=75 /DNA_ID=CAMNT_0018895123 /DNA_START=41 /DNA_END=265 /DNA_ORIENTATION=+
MELACSAILAGKSAWPMMVTPLVVMYTSFNLVSSQFPPPTAAKSIMTLPGFMPATASLVMSSGEGLPGIAAVEMT